MHDEQLIRRLPLPLAQIYRRALNAKSALERHQAGYYMWEAALKLLGAVAVTAFADLDNHDPQLVERLRHLARPSVGHWWGFVRGLLPVLADAGVVGLAPARDFVLGKSRSDLPRTAGLDAALGEAFGAAAAARSTVRISDLFDKLVRYRNREIGHGAAGQRPPAFYDRMGRALVAGVAEFLGQLDVLAGGKLIFVADVRRGHEAGWLVEQYEFEGESARRVESMELPESATPRLPRPGRLYLAGTDTHAGFGRCLHPLVVFDADEQEALFLNARRGKRGAEYLSYTTGRVLEKADLGSEHRALLAHVLGSDVVEEQVADWQQASAAEEDADTPKPTDSGPWASAPRNLGEFEVWSVLGRGGMGVVYRAWQPSLARQVALKCLLRGGDPKAEARFAREIRALGRIDHPHLVKVFTSGSDGDQWFYAMELLEGATLAAVCDKLTAQGSSAAQLSEEGWQEALSTACEESRRSEKPLSESGEWRVAGGEKRQEDTHHAPPATHHSPPATRTYIAQIVEITRQIADAAHALHEAGVIHRDIKPGNIMVTPGGGQAVLMDLGLAQLADDVDGRLTRTRQFVGTLRYASPEQVLSAGRIDRKSDVYSLGATLWELLTLRPLYAATDQTPTPELMQRIQYKDPEPARKYNAAVPKDLEAVVQKCLEKDPDRRYTSMEQLAQELACVQAGEPVQARPVGQMERAWRWCKRNPVVSGAALAVVLAMTVGTTVSYLKYLDAERQAAKAEKAREFLISILKKAETDEKGRHVTFGQLLEEAEGRIPVEFAGQPELRADLLAVIGDVKRGNKRRVAQAMILEVRGSVEPRSWDGAVKLAAPQALVNFDDQMMLAVDSTAQLVFISDFHKERLRPGSVVTIGEKGCSPSEAVLERDDSIVMTFARLAKGTFYMGWDGTPGSAKKTEIKEDFEIAAHDVTQGQWQTLMGTNPSWFSRSAGIDRVRDISDEELRLFPVEMVSWDNAQEFIRKLNERERDRGWIYRLPTEAEWEYACRAGATSEEECLCYFYFDKPTNDLSSDQANFNGDNPDGAALKGKFLRRTTRVGSYPPNGLGLFDMFGNVCQWCADLFPDGTDRVIRGGGWDGDGLRCRAPNRQGVAPTARHVAIGFRLARVPVRKTSQYSRSKFTAVR